MANTITLDGTAFQPSTRMTRSGNTVFDFNLSFYDGKQDGKAKYGNIRVKAFGDLAKNAGNVVQERDRVIVEGHLTQEHWQDRDGKDQYRLSILANDIAHTVSRFGDGGRQSDNGMDDEQIPF